MRTRTASFIAMSVLAGMLSYSPALAGKGDLLDADSAADCAEDIKAQMAEPQKFKIEEPFTEVGDNVYLAVVIMPNIYGALQKIVVGCSFYKAGIHTWVSR